MTILTRLPEDYHENTLAIRSSLQSVRFYVDGELRMEYDTSGTRLVGKNSASCYVFCPTSEDDAGKEVRIELTTNTRGVAYDYVDVVLTSVTHKVTNLITYFDFIQREKVTDTMKDRSIVAYFTTEDGEKISFDVPMIANSREDAPEKRTFHEKFTLKSREYKYGDKYYLVLADANDEKNILQQYEFMIDIAFVDDFGF
mgnify:CR=1 FL=1